MVGVELAVMLDRGYGVCVGGGGRNRLTRKGRVRGEGRMRGEG